MHDDIDCRNLDRFPKSNGKWEMQRPPLKKITVGSEKILKAIKKWYVFDPLLVTIPESTKFLPPICISSIAKDVHKSLMGRQKASVLLLVFLLFAFLTSALFFPLGLKRVKVIILLFSAVCYVLFDTYIVQNKIENVVERAIFTNWIFTRKNILLALFIGVMLVSGVVQYFAQQESGGFDSLIINYGVYFKAVESGERWRYLIGPFIHINAIHWIGNFFMGIVAAGIAGALGKKTLFFQFLIIAALSIVAAQYTPFGMRPDAIAGVSGGIFGLFGWSVGYSFKCRKMLPENFWTSLLLFSLINVVFSMISSGSTNQTTHIVGFLLGIVSGFIGVGGANFRSDAKPGGKMGLPISLTTVN